MATNRKIQKAIKVAYRVSDDEAREMVGMFYRIAA